MSTYQSELVPAPSLVKYSNPVLVSNSAKKKQLKQQTTSNTEDILNSILPPREFNLHKNQI